MTILDKVPENRRDMIALAHTQVTEALAAAGFTAPVEPYIDPIRKNVGFCVMGNAIRVREFPDGAWGITHRKSKKSSISVLPDEDRQFLGLTAGEAATVAIGYIGSKHDKKEALNLAYEVQGRRADEDEVAEEPKVEAQTIYPERGFVPMSVRSHARGLTDDEVIDVTLEKKTGKNWRSEETHSFNTGMGLCDLEWAVVRKVRKMHALPSSSYRVKVVRKAKA